MWWWILGIYLVGAIATLWLNLATIIGPANPVTVLRNALLWPIFLPILILITFL